MAIPVDMLRLGMGAVVATALYLVFRNFQTRPMGNEGDRDRITGAASTGDATQLPAVDTVAGDGDYVDGRNAQGKDLGRPSSVLGQNPRQAESSLADRGAKNVPSQSPQSNNFDEILAQSSAWLARHPASVGIPKRGIAENNAAKKTHVAITGKALPYVGAAQTSHGPVSMPINNGRASKTVGFKLPADAARAMVSYNKGTIKEMTTPAAGRHYDDTVDSSNFHTAARAGRVLKPYA